MRKLFSALLLASLAFVVMAPGSPAADEKADEGFKLLLNGKDLTGWKVKKGGESLDGKAEAAGKRFTVVDGKLVIDPKVKGDIIIETAKEFGKDVHIKFEYLAGDACNNDLFFRGQKFDITLKGVKNIKDGAWNVFEIIVQGDKIEFKNNGEVVRTAKPGPASAFGIRAEFGSIEFKKAQYKE